MKDTILLYIGWVGMGCLQFNSIPAIIQAVEAGTSTPIPTVILTIIGLSCYLAHSINRKDTLYTTGNIVGITGNLILLWCIL